MKAYQLDIFGNKVEEFLNDTITKKNNDSEAFADKFKAKHTSDECFTPPDIYNTALEWFRSHSPEVAAATEIVRPFKPNGDYENETYSVGCVVVDNPPFSIFAKIVRFYMEHNIKFVLWCDNKIIGQYLRRGCNAVVSFPVNTRMVR